jgi:hypothetical protein
MAMTPIFFDSAIEKLVELAFNAGTDTWKIALSNTEPTAATDDELADIDEIDGLYGYTAGGDAVTVNVAAQSGGTYTVTLTGDITWTASGGTIGPFQYFVLYNDTLAGDPLILYWDYGSGISVTNGNNITLSTDGMTLLTVAAA